MQSSLTWPSTTAWTPTCRNWTGGGGPRPGAQHPVAAASAVSGYFIASQTPAKGARALKEAESSPPHPLRVFDVAVGRVQELTPNFRRITFIGPDLDAFGVPGASLDLRIKLLLPVPGHPISRPGSPSGHLHDGWYQDWLRVNPSERGWLRSYTVRALRTTAHGRELDVDFVIHSDSGSAHSVSAGHRGPGSDWARAAAPGVRAVIVGPDANTITRATLPSETGIRWDPQNARHVLLAGDETAVPAIGAILEALPADITGMAFLEVPDSRDFQDLKTESGVKVSWLARTSPDAPRGRLLCDAVRAAHGASGFRATAAAAGAHEMYAWVAAEAGTVKELRQYLVHHLGVDPRRSELRAYWSLGKAGSGSNGIPIQQETRQLSRTAAG